MSESRRYAIVKGTRKEHWSRHPLFLALIGFLLTGLVGATITFLYSRLSTEREHAVERISARRQAILAIHTALFEYEGASIRLAMEINIRTPPDALLNAFKSYQEATTHAYAALPATSFSLYQQGPRGDGDGSSGGWDFEDAPDVKTIDNVINDMINNRLEPLLQYSDSCLTLRYAELVGTGRGPASDECGDVAWVPPAFPLLPHNFTDRLRAYSDCSQALTSVMLGLGADPDETLWNEYPVDASLVKAIAQYFDKTCPPLGKPVASR